MDGCTRPGPRRGRCAGKEARGDCVCSGERRGRGPKAGSFSVPSGVGGRLPFCRGGGCSDLPGKVVPTVNEQIWSRSGHLKDTIAPPAHQSGAIGPFRHIDWYICWPEYRAFGNSHRNKTRRGVELDTWHYATVRKHHPHALLKEIYQSTSTRLTISGAKKGPAFGLSPPETTMAPRGAGKGRAKATIHITHGRGNDEALWCIASYVPWMAVAGRTTHTGAHTRAHWHTSTVCPLRLTWLHCSTGWRGRC